ncbi:MAG: ComEC/Rec2 family competence protein [Candidatus Omnitrophota bacterium]
MKKPLAALILFYCLGIILGRLILINFWVIMFVGAVVFIVAGIFKENNYIFPVLVLFLTLLVGVGSLRNSYLLPGCHISKFVYYQDDSLYSLSGFVDSVMEVKSDHTEFIFRVREIQAKQLKWHCCGKILVKSGNTFELNYGDNLLLIGRLSRPYSFGMIGRSYKDFLARQGIYLVMSISDFRQIIRLPGNSGSNLIKFSFNLRARLEKIISRSFDGLSGGILAAMVLGQKRNVPWLVNNYMVRSGTVHILVVSGFNVGIVAFMVNLLFKIFRLPHKIRIILTIICLFIYCLITGSSNPVVRATVMGVIFLSAYLLKRDPDIYNSLSLAALFILAINPRQLFDIGFQLSFISVLAIVYLYPKLKCLIHLQDCKLKIVKFAAEGFLVSLSAWFGTFGIIAFNFHIVAPITVLANIFIVPLATVITLCGFTLVISGLLCPSLASLFSLPISLLINLLLSLNAAIIRIPFAYFYL